MKHAIRFSAPAVLAFLLACEVESGETEALGTSADDLVTVSQFGDNPGALKMYVHSPSGAPVDAPLVVVMHGCTQSAADYANAGWNELADRWGFHVVYPEQQKANNQNKCFNWFEAADTQRGKGEVKSIVSMVNYMKSHHDIDASRVFVTGLSAGGAMTSVMLATHPDVFAGGAIMAGLPYGCADSVSTAFTCMNPGRDLSATAWGNKVRAASNHAGPWPRVAIWHGTSDTTVAPKNVDEMVEQWTNVHGIDASADANENVSGATHRSYRDGDGNTRVESYLVPNMTHGTALDPGLAEAGGCGRAGAYMLDVGLCSTLLAAEFFGLGPVDGGEGGGGGEGGAPSITGSGGSDGGSGGAASATTSTAATTGGGTSCIEHEDTNYHHVIAGRATRCGIGGSYVCTVGSGQNFGLWVMTKTWLRETAPGYFELGRCP